MPVAMAKMLGSKMMSSGSEAVRGEQLVGALADLDLARRCVGLADLVERHDDHGGAVSAALAGELEERPPRLPSC